MASIRGSISTASNLPARKVIGAAMMAIGIGPLTLLSPLSFFFIYPLAAMLLVVAAVATQLFARRPKWISRAMECSAWALIGTATIVAALFIALAMSVVLHTGGHDFLNINGWIWIAALLVPQLLWFSRFRANSWAVLSIALIALVPYVVAMKDWRTFDFE